MPNTSRFNGNISKIANAIKDNVGKLYQSTYFTQATNARDLAGIKKDISNNINAITTNNLETNGVANISSLYNRISALNKDSDFKKRLEDVFSDKANMDDIMQTYMENKYLDDLDKEIDVVCKYMPKLLEALDTRKDNVLSADHFSKDFISVPNSSTINNNTFAERIQSIKDKYDLLSEAESWYDNAAKYGEQFLYIVPYSKAISRLKNAQNGYQSSFMATTESGKCVIKESKEFDRAFSAAKSNVMMSEKSCNLNIEINNLGIIDEVVRERMKGVEKRKVVSEASLCLEHSRYIKEQAYLEAQKSIIGFDDIEGAPGKNNEDEVLGKRKLKLDDSMTSAILKIKDDPTLSSDGFIDPNKNKNKFSETDFKVPGCIVKKLKRSLVKPIYIEDICIGYYYIELRKGEQVDFSQSGSILDPTMNMAKSQMQKQAAEITKQDALLKTMASQISGFIDSKFVNNNIDISKEIYMILKYNDLYNSGDTSMRITFIPPEDIVHIKFKEDPITHRGISDLDRALFPAKLYACLYITNVIALMTRSYDKRVYYVKQTIDNNIAKTLLSTINQIKKSNFGLRQIENINNVLNLTGAFNDYLIPTSSTNDPPIQFEIMQGQQLNTPTDLLDMLEEMAVNSTDVPIELINARQSMDYAVQYTMTNSKFLRKVYNRQGVYQRILSDIFSRIYNYEYGTDEDLKVTLPPPVFLNITNTSQIINNTADFANAIVDIRMANEDDVVKNEFARRVKEHYLGSYLDTSQLDKLESDARQAASMVHIHQ